MSKRRNKNKAHGPVKIIVPAQPTAPAITDAPDAHDAMLAAADTPATTHAAESLDAAAQMSPETLRPAQEFHDDEDASAALVRDMGIESDAVASEPSHVESAHVELVQIDDAHPATDSGEQESAPHAVESHVAEVSGKKGKKHDRKLKLNKWQKQADSVPAVALEPASATSEPIDSVSVELAPVEPEPTVAPRQPHVAAFAKLNEYQQLSLAHVPGLPEETDVPGHWRGVGFGLGGRRLVSAFDEVVEIIAMPQITNVPGTQPWMLGVANVRGTLLPVVDLKQFLEGERTVLHAGQRVLVVRQGGGNVAVLIDQLYGQRSFNDSQKAVLADDESRYGHFIKQMYRVGDNDWGVFSMSMLARTPEFRQAAA